MQFKLCGRCGRLIDLNGPSRCAPCQKKDQIEEDRNPTRERAFYQTSEWKAFRAAYLKENPPCRICLEQKGSVIPARVCDHIVPIRKGGSKFAPENIQPLCIPCHNRKSATEKHEQERARKYPDLQQEDEAKTITSLNQLGRKESKSV